MVRSTISAVVIIMYFWYFGNLSLLWWEVIFHRFRLFTPSINVIHSHPIVVVGLIFSLDVEFIFLD